MHCDDCDPSFNCWQPGGAACRKKLLRAPDLHPGEYVFPKTLEPQSRWDYVVWRSMSSYPMTGPVRRVQVLMQDGTVHPDAHYASDLSGECQPPFDGWFIPSGSKGFVGIDTPRAWAPQFQVINLGPFANTSASFCFGGES